MVKESTNQCSVDNIVDVPEVIFSHLRQSIVRAIIIAIESGVVAGIETLEYQAKRLGLQTITYFTSGSEISNGDVVSIVTGDPVQIVQGEDILLGTVAKFSGIATAARTAVRSSENIRVVCGGWKKLPAGIKNELRNAITVGGADIQIVSQPFLYLDKNYVRILGSLAEALKSAEKFAGRTVVIQLRGETAPIAEEAIIAARHGAQVLMVDSGRISDLRDVSAALRSTNLREQVKIAFGGNITLTEMERLQNEDLNIVDIGRAILDAPLLDFRYDVIEVKGVNDGNPSF